MLIKSRGVQPRIMAGIFCCLSGVSVFVVWYIFLFVSPVSGVPLAKSALGQIQYVFSSVNPAEQDFYWLAVLPFASTLVGGAYFSAWAKTAPFAAVLFVLAVLLLALTLALLDWPFAVFALLSAISAWQHLRFLRSGNSFAEVG